MQKNVIKQGYLEKHGGKGLMASWTTRWFVLTSESLTYYTEPSLAVKKGEVIFNPTCSVHRSAAEGSRKYLLTLENKITGRSLLMCPPNLSLLVAWEEALECVLGSVEDKWVPESDISIRDTSISSSSCSVAVVDPTIGANNIAEFIKVGYIQKQGHRVQSWTNRWFVLTRYSLSYFSDETMSIRKGGLPIDHNSFVTRRSTKRTTLSGKKHLFCLYIGERRQTLLMNASSEDSRTEWMSAINTTVFMLKHIKHVVAVRVSICGEDEQFVVHTDEPVFAVRVYLDSKVTCTEYHHYADIRKVYKMITLAAGAVCFDNAFPRSYKRTSFGVSLTDDELEMRRYHLEKWLQELIVKFHEFDYLSGIDGSNDIQSAIATLYGFTSPFGLANYLKMGAASHEVKKGNILARKAYSDVVSKEPDSDDEYTDTGESTTASVDAVVSSDSNCATSMTSITSVTEAPTGDQDISNQSSHDHSFRTNSLPIPISPRNGDMFADDYPEGHSTELGQDPGIYQNDEDEVPMNASLLKKYPIRKLARFCQMKRIDSTTFKSQKHYVKALLETSEEEPRLQGKQVLALVKRLVHIVESKKQQVIDANTTTEIHSIFTDMLRKLRVVESISKTMEYEYSTHDKLGAIVSCLSIWDDDGEFNREDCALLSSLRGSIRVDSLLLLALKCRLSQASVSNEWMNRFCARRGITTLTNLMLDILDEEPLSQLNGATLLQLLYCFRLVVDSNCIEAVVDSRSTIEAFVRSLKFEMKAVAVEALELLSETIVHGGSTAAWKVVSCLNDYAKSHDEKPFEILVVACNGGDVVIQYAVISLINSIMLYESDVEERIRIRNCLSDLGFESMCTMWVKEYRKAGGAVVVLPTVEETASKPLVPAVPAERSEQGEITEEVDIESDIEYTYRRKLRGGVRVADQILEEHLAEDDKTVVVPTAGIMEGYAIQITDVSHDTPSASDITHNIGKFLIGKTKATEVEKKKDMFKARRLWYRILETSVVWFDSEEGGHEPGVGGELGCFRLTDVNEIIDYGTISPKFNLQLQNCFSVQFKDGSQHHMYFDCIEHKHQWYVALNAVLNRVLLPKTAYRLPIDDGIHTSALLKLRKNFENFVTIYKTVAKEDIAIVYDTTVSDMVEESAYSCNTSSDTMFLTLFMHYELKNHKNGGKMHSALHDLAAYVYKNYAPQPPSKDDDGAGKNHPLAVPDSTRSVPRAPALPPVPVAKPVKMPNVKLKQLYWTKTKPVNVIHTVWETMTEPSITWESLENRFLANQPKPKKKNNGSAVPCISTKKKLVSLFDGRRTQNVAIACGKLRKSPEELYEMVLALDPEELTSDVNDTVLNLLIPTADELTTLAAYQGSIDDLDYCGRLFSLFTGIERLEQRLHVQRIMLNWSDQVAVLFEQLNTVQQAVKEIQSESCISSLEFVLSVILSIGNYMNGMTNRGQAHGYRLDILLKLKDVRQSGEGVGRRHLLHFIVEQISLYYPNVLKFYDSWKCVWATIKIRRQNLEILMRDIESALELCVNEIEASDLIENELVRTPLVNRLRAFISSSSEAYKELVDKFEDTDRSVLSIKRYLGETVLGHNTSTDDDPWQTFFTLVVKFANMYKVSLQEMEDWKKSEERQRNKLSAKQLAAINQERKALRKSIKDPKLEMPEQNTAEKAAIRKRVSVKKSEDMMKVFKAKMMIIRKKNALEVDSDISDDEDGEEW